MIALKLFFKKNAGLLITVVYAVAIYIWWGVCHQADLAFQEQYQMFLFNGGYFIERVSVAGGVADYIAEFIIQFFYYPRWGALFLVALYVLLQHATWLLLRRISGNDGFHVYMASYIPAAYLLYAMGDVSVMLSLPVSLLIALAVTLLYIRWQTEKMLLRIAVFVLLVPLLYWGIGPMMFLAVTIVVCERMLSSSEGMVCKGARALFIVIYSLLAVFCISYFFMKQYVWYDVWFGINYYRVPMAMMQSVPSVIYTLPLVLLAVLLFVHLFGRRLNGVWTSVIMVVAVAVMFSLAAIKSYDKDEHELVEQNYLLRQEKWDEIISRAEKYQVHDASSAVTVNLALAKKGLLADRMFSFYQCGTDGLIMPFVRDYMTCVSTSEAFYQLGFVNSALRFSFDIQECTFNNRKSGRFTKRIVEIYIVNGRYDVARKHIDRLKQTLFYSSWAKEAEMFLGNEQKINLHPKWGALRKKRFKSDFFYNINELDKMLGLLYMNNRDNRMALDYFLASLLLKGDLQQFCGYLPGLASDLNGYLARHYQEAFAMFWGNSHSSFDGVPVPISGQVVQDMQRFVQATAQHGGYSGTDAYLQHTYWAYYMKMMEQSANNVDAESGASTLKH
ncbi:MAG: hypothetical protein J5676_03660 [Bacteroidaceae bacterium]|nr:hypothetical protein [Bacteroidaceae bacterium]